MTRYRYGVVLLFSLCVITLCCTRTVAAAAQTPVQALDPLSAEEKRIAERLVRGHQRARELLGERATLASIEFLAIKGRRGPDDCKPFG